MTPERVTVRVASREDAEAIATLEVLAFESPWSRPMIDTELDAPGTRAWVAECDAVAVGFALFRQVADESELLRLAVDPAWRRSGIGGELTARGLAAAIEAGIATCFLEVRDDNLAAHRLYERLGFELTARRARYYADGADACIYRRPLPASFRG